MCWYLPLLTLATFSAGTQLALDFTASPSMVLSELKLPEGVSIPALEHGDDYDTALVNAIFIREGQGSGELAAEADAALAAGEEPELGEEEAAEEGAEGEEGEEGEDKTDDESRDKSGDDK